MSMVSSWRCASCYANWVTTNTANIRAAGAWPLDWLGPNKAVYCADFPVGARFREIEDGLEPGQFTRLGAVRWPDDEILFDNGERFALNP
jgi:hypothetical protein